MAPTAIVENIVDTVLATSDGWSERWASALEPRRAWKDAGRVSRRATILDCSTIDSFVASRMPTVPCNPTRAACSPAAKSSAASSVGTSTGGPPCIQSTNSRAIPGTRICGTTSSRPSRPMSSTPSRDPVRCAASRARSRVGLPPVAKSGPGVSSSTSPLKDSANSSSLQVRCPIAGSFRYQPSLVQPSTTRKWLYRQ